MEMWALLIVFLISSLGVLGMLGYTKNETEKLELKHLLASEQLRREMSEIEENFISEDAKKRETIQELTAKIDELEEENAKLHTTLDKLRKQQAAQERREALSAVPAATAV
jgi:hypothetical protein